jgi:hypothetical protein
MQKVDNSIYVDFISSLNEYSLDVKMLSRMNAYTEKISTSLVDGEIKGVETNSTKHNSENTTNIKLKERFFFPSEEDQLFWCYYIFVNGFQKYDFLETTKFVTEKTEKLSCIDILRQNKKQLTPFRIKGLKDTVEDDLVNSKKISLKTFIALCIVSSMNVMYIHNRKYYEITCDPDNVDKVFVIHQFDTPVMRYAYEENVTKETLQKYREERYCSHSIDSPLKSISSYKVGELRDICSLLHIDSSFTEKKTKPQLYQLIVESL